MIVRLYPSFAVDKAKRTDSDGGNDVESEYSTKDDAGAGDNGT